MRLRHEYKHYLNHADYLLIKKRLSAVMRRDAHASKDGSYEIRSLYFDSASDKALREKIDGIAQREKFRIRCYDYDYEFIRLEKKIKQNGLGCKISAPLSKDEVNALLQGDTSWMKNSREALIIELYEKMKTEGLRPKTLVDYTREPFVYPAGNVRVTLDYNIRTGLWETDFLNKNTPFVTVSPETYILEVKYDGFLPDMIRDAVQLGNREAGAFSKYAECRKFG